MGENPISVPDAGSIMFGLPGFRVLAAGEVCGELELLVETTEDRATCPECGRPAASHDRREHLLRDIAHGDQPVFVLWCSRIWRCRAEDCPKRTWSERAPLAAPKATLTNRVRAWGARRVGQHAETVAATARALGVRTRGNGRIPAPYVYPAAALSPGNRHQQRQRPPPAAQDPNDTAPGRPER